jgi:hypothetical protein
MIDDFAPVQLHADPFSDFAHDGPQTGRPIFLTTASPEILLWDDAAPSGGGGFHIAPDDWFDPGLSDNPKGDLEPQFSVYDGTTTLPPVDVEGERDMTLEEIDAIIAAYNAANSNGGSSGTGGGSGSTTQSLGPDLTIYDCEHLANLEEQIRNNMEAARSLAVGLLNLTAPFQGDDLFDEIWNVFENLNDQGLYDSGDPWGTMSRVAGQTVSGTDLIDLSMLGIATNVTITAYQLFMVQSAFAYQLNLDRIDAEQARRGGGCGS